MDGDGKEAEGEISRGTNAPRGTPTGILRVDSGKSRRTSLDIKLLSQYEPASPQPSVDRLSVTFADDSQRSDRTEPSPKSMDKVHFPAAHTDEENSEDEDYSASVTAIMQRRASTRRSKKRSGRRGSSPFSPDILPENENGRRRSSVFTTSSGDTAITMEDSFTPSVTQDQIFENIKLHKEVLGSVKMQPWNMRKKLRLVVQAKSYIKRHEGALQERLAQSHSTRDMLARCNIYLVKVWQQCKREAANLSNWLIPWELRIKEIESHFGSVVASYFIFLRWLFWVNMVISIVLIAFVAVPEMLMADFKKDPERKAILPEDRYNSTNFLTLWDFEGVFKYSPMFYGWYTNLDLEDKAYRLPLAYFFTGLAVYVYSFVATLRKMAKNSRMSKLSEKDDECIFSWKLFTGWDYMIGNAETAHNRVASIVMSFKEALLEEAEKKRESKSWKLIGSRILVNTGVLGLLFLSAFAVVTVVARSNEKEANSTTWRRNEITVVMSLISLFFPIFFELLGYFEHYHPRKQLRLQLARIMVLNLLNLYSLIFALFGKISNMTHDLEALKPANTTRVPFNNNTTSPVYSTPPTQSTEAFFNSCYTICEQNGLEAANLISSALTNWTQTVLPTIPSSPENITQSINHAIDDVTKSLPINLGNAFKLDLSSFRDKIQEFWDNITDEGKWDHFPTSTYTTTEAATTTTTPLTTIIEEITSTIRANTTNCRLHCETSNETQKVPVISGYKRRSRLRSLCWETMFGQELMKLTVMDLVLMVLSTLAIDFLRGLFVRYMNNCWCWDLEKTFPQYGDFKVAENILHLVNNQGMVWMGMFFSPGLVVLNVFKLYVMMYLRSWAVLACNVPHEIIFRASRSNNFYFALLLSMLFLCVLPVGYTIVWLEPSWHCGPFSKYHRIFHIFTKTIRKALPEPFHKILDYIASPGIVIPLLVLLVLIIYYLISLTNALREANNDLKIQLRRERTEERRKMFQIADKRLRRTASGGSSELNQFGKWKKLLQGMPGGGKSFEDTPKESSEIEDLQQKTAKRVLSRFIFRSIKNRKQSISDEDSVLHQDDGTDTEQHESLPDDGSFRLRPLKLDSLETGDKPFRKTESKSFNSDKKQKTLDSLESADRKLRKLDSLVRSSTESGDKHQKRGYKKKKDVINRVDSVSSNWSENIPVITISKTESSECILEAVDNQEAESKPKIKKQVSEMHDDETSRAKALRMLRSKFAGGHERRGREDGGKEECGLVYKSVDEEEGVSERKRARKKNKTDSGDKIKKAKEDDKKSTRKRRIKQEEEDGISVEKDLGDKCVSKDESKASRFLQHFFKSGASDRKKVGDKESEKKIIEESKRGESKIESTDGGVKKTERKDKKRKERPEEESSKSKKGMIMKASVDSKESKEEKKAGKLFKFPLLKKGKSIRDDSRDSLEETTKVLINCEAEKLSKSIRDEAEIIPKSNIIDDTKDSKPENDSFLESVEADEEKETIVPSNKEESVSGKSIGDPPKVPQGGMVEGLVDVDAKISSESIRDDSRDLSKASAKEGKLEKFDQSDIKILEEGKYSKSEAKPNENIEEVKSTTSQQDPLEGKPDGLLKYNEDKLLKTVRDQSKELQEVLIDNEGEKIPKSGEDDSKTLHKQKANVKTLVDNKEEPFSKSAENDTETSQNAKAKILFDNKEEKFSGSLVGDAKTTQKQEVENKGEEFLESIPGQLKDDKTIRSKNSKDLETPLISKIQSKRPEESESAGQSERTEAKVKTVKEMRKSEDKAKDKKRPPTDSRKKNKRLSFAEKSGISKLFSRSGRTEGKEIPIKHDMEKSKESKKKDLESPQANVNKLQAGRDLQLEFRNIIETVGIAIQQSNVDQPKIEEDTLRIVDSKEEDIKGVSKEAATESDVTTPARSQLLIEGVTGTGPSKIASEDAKESPGVDGKKSFDSEIFNQDVKESLEELKVEERKDGDFEINKLKLGVIKPSVSTKLEDDDKQAEAVLESNTSKNKKPEEDKVVKQDVLESNKLSDFFKSDKPEGKLVKSKYSKEAGDKSEKLKLEDSEESKRKFSKHTLDGTKAPKLKDLDKVKNIGEGSSEEKLKGDDLVGKAREDKQVEDSNEFKSTTERSKTENSLMNKPILEDSCKLKQTSDPERLVEKALEVKLEDKENSDSKGFEVATERSKTENSIKNKHQTVMLEDSHKLKQPSDPERFVEKALDVRLEEKENEDIKGSEDTTDISKTEDSFKTKQTSDSKRSEDTTERSKLEDFLKIKKLEFENIEEQKGSNELKGVNKSKLDKSSKDFKVGVEDLEHSSSKMKSKENEDSKESEDKTTFDEEYSEDLSSKIQPMETKGSKESEGKTTSLLEDAKSKNLKLDDNLIKSDKSRMEESADNLKEMTITDVRVETKPKEAEMFGLEISTPSKNLKLGEDSLTIKSKLVGDDSTDNLEDTIITDLKEIKVEEVGVELEKSTPSKNLELGEDSLNKSKLDGDDVKDFEGKDRLSGSKSQIESRAGESTPIESETEVLQKLSKEPQLERNASTIQIGKDTLQKLEMSKTPTKPQLGENLSKAFTQKPSLEESSGKSALEEKYVSKHHRDNQSGTSSSESIENQASKSDALKFGKGFQNVTSGNQQFKPLEADDNIVQNLEEGFALQPEIDLKNISDQHLVTKDREETQGKSTTKNQSETKSNAEIFDRCLRMETPKYSSSERKRDDFAGRLQDISRNPSTSFKVDDGLSGVKSTPTKFSNDEARKNSLETIPEDNSNPIVTAVEVELEEDFSKIEDNEERNKRMETIPEDATYSQEDTPKCEEIISGSNPIELGIPQHASNECASDKSEGVDVSSQSMIERRAEGTLQNITTLDPRLPDSKGMLRNVKKSFASNKEEGKKRDLKKLHRTTWIQEEDNLMLEKRSIHFAEGTSKENMMLPVFKESSIEKIVEKDLETLSVSSEASRINLKSSTIPPAKKTFSKSIDDTSMMIAPLSPTLTLFGNRTCYNDDSLESSKKIAGKGFGYASPSDDEVIPKVDSKEDSSKPSEVNIMSTNKYETDTTNYRDYSFEFSRKLAGKGFGDASPLDAKIIPKEEPRELSSKPSGVNIICSIEDKTGPTLTVSDDIKDYRDNFLEWSGNIAEKGFGNASTSDEKVIPMEESKKLPSEPSGVNTTGSNKEETCPTLTVSDDRKDYTFDSLESSGKIYEQGFGNSSTSDKMVIPNEESKEFPSEPSGVNIMGSTKEETGQTLTVSNDRKYYRDDSLESSGKIAEKSFGDASTSDRKAIPKDESKEIPSEPPLVNTVGVNKTETSPTLTAFDGGKYFKDYSLESARKIARRGFENVSTEDEKIIPNEDSKELSSEPSGAKTKYSNKEEISQTPTVFDDRKSLKGYPLLSSRNLFAKGVGNVSPSDDKVIPTEDSKPFVMETLNKSTEDSSKKITTSKATLPAFGEDFCGPSRKNVGKGFEDEPPLQQQKIETTTSDPAFPVLEDKSDSNETTLKSTVIKIKIPSSATTNKQSLNDSPNENTTSPSNKDCNSQIPSEEITSNEKPSTSFFSKLRKLKPGKVKKEKKLRDTSLETKPQADILSPISFKFKAKPDPPSSTKILLEAASDQAVATLKSLEKIADIGSSELTLPDSIKPELHKQENPITDKSGMDEFDNIKKLERKTQSQNFPTLEKTNTTTGELPGEDQTDCNYGLRTSNATIRGNPGVYNYKLEETKISESALYLKTSPTQGEDKTRSCKLQREMSFDVASIGGGSQLSSNIAGGASEKSKPEEAKPINKEPRAKTYPVVVSEHLKPVTLRSDDLNVPQNPIDPSFKYFEKQGEVGMPKFGTLHWDDDERNFCNEEKIQSLNLDADWDCKKGENVKIPKLNIVIEAKDESINDDKRKNMQSAEFDSLSLKGGVGILKKRETSGIDQKLDIGGKLVDEKITDSSLLIGGGENLNKPSCADDNVDTNTKKSNSIYLRNISRKQSPETELRFMVGTTGTSKQELFSESSEDDPKPPPEINSESSSSEIDDDKFGTMKRGKMLKDSKRDPNETESSTEYKDSNISN